jgi:gas vesicle protein
MSTGDRIVRGILIGGAIGAFGAIFGLTENMFVSVGLGAVAGFCAGLTHAALDKKRKQ